MTDRFTTGTTRKIAGRVGYRCSKPDCRVTTIGPASNDYETINIGVAAHITAASPNGPRYDQKLTSDQRRHPSNGIWLCQNHAKLIDSDAAHFTVQELLCWKRSAEHQSFSEIVSSKLSLPNVLPEDNADVQAAIDLFQNYSKTDLSAFRRMPGWPSHAIALNLKKVDNKSTEVFTASGLASATEAFDEIAVIAPPGTGKTTTLLQLMATILHDTSFVAVFVPLGEWSTRADTFFQSMLRRKAFRHANQGQFELLADHGRLVLILDGWNELDETSKLRVRSDIKSLRRDFPNLRLVVSSRHRDFNLPTDGPVVAVDALSEEQQLEIAKALCGHQGESLMDHAWRTPGIRELVRVPLYLTALLKQSPEGSLPTTKEEVLGSFIKELERDPDKLAVLRETLQGFHRNFLEAIAAEATRQGTVALSKSCARAVVSSVQERLRTDKQIVSAIEPRKALDALVDTHLLARPSAESDAVSFQHQQFQEWFASSWVSQLMLSAGEGDGDARKTLREEVLDVPAWEESVLFACDRLSSHADQDSVQAVATAIIETLGIDPLFAAEMISRSPDPVWKRVRNDVMPFVKKWHTKGHVDRAVKFMIDTGQAEFSQYVWPLISNPDSQVHLRALRAGRKFKPSVLGPEGREWIDALPENLRINVVAEIASNGGMDGIEFATTLAKDDASFEVQSAVIESLLFRRADRFVKDILDSAPDEVWRSLAKKWHPSEFADPEVSARMVREAEELFAAETEPGKILNTLLSSGTCSSGTGSKIRELIQEAVFSDSQDNAWVVRRAYEQYPDDVAEALIYRLERGKSVPPWSAEFLRASDIVIDGGPVCEGVLQNSGEEMTIAISIVGSKTVGQLIDQMFSIHARIDGNDGGYDEVLSLESRRLSDWMSNTKAESLIEAVLERPATEKPEEIALLVNLMAWHGRNPQGGPLGIDNAAKRRVVALVQQWAEILLASPVATREQLVGMARAADRLESPVLAPVLQELLSQELARQKQALREFLDAQEEGRQIQNDARISWTFDYWRAFAAISGDQTVQIMKKYLRHPECSLDAARVLKTIWRKSQSSEDKTGFPSPWPDFSVVPEQSLRRQSRTGGGTHAFADDILSVVDDLIKLDASDADCKQALKLAAAAFSMPYVDKADMIASLLQLQLPAIDKQGLLTVLALSGETISSGIVYQGIEELLEEAKTNPWRLQEQNGWELNAWLRLLPFTENPTSVLEVFDSLGDRQLAPWNLRELLSALSYAPSGEAEEVLGELARRDQRFLNEYDWLAALTNRNTLKAARILLDLVCDLSHPDSGGIRDNVNLGNALSQFMACHGQFRQEVYERFPSVPEGPAKSVLEYGIADAADTDGVLLLTREGAARNTTFGTTTLSTALRKVLLEHRPIESLHIQEVHSLPAPELRRQLFNLVVNGTSSESRLAAECLAAIDEIRDDYGHVDVEPRHPNISMGVPWPPINLAEPPLQE